MDMSAVIVGSSGSVPTAGRGLPSVLVRHGSSRILVDCGEGTQRQLVRSVGLVDVDMIVFTHFHADHWLGLPGLLKTLELRDRERPLTICGPAGLDRVLELTVAAVGSTRFQLDAHVLGSGEGQRVGDLNMTPVSVEHRGEAFGYVFHEDERPGKVDAERANELGISHGPDIGRLQAGETVGEVTPEQVLGAPRQGRKLVISGDTRPSAGLAVAAHQADVLIHEATFLDEELDRAEQKSHSTAAGAARLALESKVKLLVLTHLSSRYNGRELRDEAREIFPATKVARDFDIIDLPLPERGPPTYSRWHDAGPRRNGPSALKESSDSSAILRT